MTSTIEDPVRFASQIDAFAFGEYRRPTGDGRQLAGRITCDGSGSHPAASGRYHLYAGRFCPRSHRATIVLSLLGLTEVVSVSYVDGMRDGRGWAFRERTGPDPVNGFTLLRQAYDAGRMDYRGDVSVPALWDREEAALVTNDPNSIDSDLATEFASWSSSTVDLCPVRQQAATDALSEEIAELDECITRAVYLDGAKSELRRRLRDFDTRLAGQRYLLGNTITLADIRLWVLLVRYDAGPNAAGAAGVTLGRFRNLWAYARDLYAHQAFQDTTDFSAFAAPLARLPDWTERADRG